MGVGVGVYVHMRRLSSVNMMTRGGRGGGGGGGGIQYDRYAIVSTSAKVTYRYQLADQNN